MAARPELARKVLLYWMDGMIAVSALLFTGVVASLFEQGVLSLPHALAVEAGLLGISGMFPLILRAAYDDKPRPTGLLVISGLLVLAVIALIPPRSTTASWEALGALWLAGLAIHVPLLVTIGVGVAIGALTIGLEVLVNGQSLVFSALNICLGLTLTPIAMWLWLWMWRTIKEAHESQEAKARLAVSEERLRFARDLHDLLGHSLSVISLKSELAAKLAAKDAGRAAGEMAQVRELAGEALVEVQAAVEGYRTLDLDEELAGVRAALEAAGARCTIEVSAGDLSPGARALLAWAVREGATNILKHSTATRCAITIDHGVLEMRNNGVHRHAGESGSGLRGLAERMTTAGGSFTASQTGSGEFLLRAAVPA